MTEDKFFIAFIGSSIFGSGLSSDEAIDDAFRRYEGDDDLEVDTAKASEALYHEVREVGCRSAGFCWLNGTAVTYDEYDAANPAVETVDTDEVYGDEDDQASS